VRCGSPAQLLRCWHHQDTELRPCRAVQDRRGARGIRAVGKETPDRWQRATEFVFDDIDFNDINIQRRWLRDSKSVTKVSKSHGRQVKPGLVSKSAEGEESAERPALATSRQVLAAVKTGRYTIDVIETELLLVSRLNNFEVSKLKADRGAVFEAIEHEPKTILPHVNFQMALEVVMKVPGTYGFLAQDLKEDRVLLYAALECDSALVTDFLSSSGKSEINAWLWHSNMQRKGPKTQAASGPTAVAPSSLTKEPKVLEQQEQGRHTKNQAAKKGQRNMIRPPVNRKTGYFHTKKGSAPPSASVPSPAPLARTKSDADALASGLRCIASMSFLGGRCR